MALFHQAPFVYDQSVDLGTNAGALEKFLFDTHRGFCEQYAAAFAELARAIGLPTRVAVGYQPGRLDGDGIWHVSERDAHAWPEVWLGPKVGWYRFEPTPGRTDPVTGLGGPTSVGTGGPTTTTPPTTAANGAPTTVSPTPSTVPQSANLATPPPSARSSHTRAHALTLAFVVLVLILGAFVLFVLGLAIRAWRRTGRRRHDPDDRRRVLGAWTEALERLAAAGIERRPSTTSLEFALRQAPALGAGAAGPPLMSLARLHTAAMYSPDPPTADEADEAWSEVDSIAAALRTTVPRTRRWRARWQSELRRPRATPASPPFPTTRTTRTTRSAPGGKRFDERVAFETEGAHVGVDLGGHLVDRDEQRELARAQRIEDLTVVVARPHVAAVGDRGAGSRGRDRRRAPPPARPAPGRWATPCRASNARPAARRDHGRRSARRRRPG